MRKLSSLLIGLLLIFSLVSCTQTPQTPTPSTAANTSDPSAQSSATPVIENTATPPLQDDLFKVSDLVVGELKLDTPKADVIAALGQPDDIESQTEAASGTLVETLVYGNNEIILRDGVLRGALLNDDTLTGPKGLKVGDSMQQVLSSFKSSDDDVLYFAKELDDGSLFPPYGLVTYSDDGSCEIEYVSPEDDYDESVQAEPLSYVFTSHGVLTFKISDEDKVLEIYFIVMPLAE
jgi:hypothetical protein